MFLDQGTTGIVIEGNERLYPMAAIAPTPAGDAAPTDETKGAQDSGGSR